MPRETITNPLTWLWQELERVCSAETFATLRTGYRAQNTRYAAWRRPINTAAELRMHLRRDRDNPAPSNSTRRRSITRARNYLAEHAPDLLAEVEAQIASEESEGDVSITFDQEPG